MIDWLAVHMVVTGTPLKLTPTERKMAMRRLSERLLTLADSYMCPGNKLTADEVARRLQVTPRSVVRYNTELPRAEKRVCPVCREPMWVVDGVVEVDADSVPRGPGRPDVYLGQWARRGAMDRGMYVVHTSPKA